MTMETITNILREAKAPGLGNIGYIIKRVVCRRDPDGIFEMPELLISSGIVHPGTAETKRLLPEEYRGEDFIVIYTDTQEGLCAGAELGAKLFFRADEIKIRDESWRVVAVQEWRNHGYCRAAAVRIRD